MKPPADLYILGFLLILSGILDLFLIINYPTYEMSIFGATAQGFTGWLFKLLSPLFHVIVGIGCIGLKRWAFILLIGFSGYGFTNALANYLLYGFGKIRMIFLKAAA